MAKLNLLEAQALLDEHEDESQELLYELIGADDDWYDDEPMLSTGEMMDERESQFEEEMSNYDPFEDHYSVFDHTDWFGPCAA